MLHVVSFTLSPFVYVKIQTDSPGAVDQEGGEGEDGETGEKEAPKEAEASNAVEKPTQTTATQGDEEAVPTEKEMILGW